MANLTQAPHLIHKGAKSRRMDSKGNFELFYTLPQDLMDAIFSRLSGKNGNMIKLMCVLCGTLGNGTFSVSEMWLYKRTGMEHKAYIEARKRLCDMGWLSHRKARNKNHYIITVHFDAIFDGTSTAVA